MDTPKDPGHPAARLIAEAVMEEAAREEAAFGPHGAHWRMDEEAQRDFENAVDALSGLMVLSAESRVALEPKEISALLWLLHGSLLRTLDGMAYVRPRRAAAG